MRKFILLFATCLFASACVQKNDGTTVPRQSLEDMPAQEFYDNFIRHSIVCDSTGHEYILHEFGNRGQYNYSFSIHESPACAQCYDIYD